MVSGSEKGEAQESQDGSRRCLRGDSLRGFQFCGLFICNENAFPWSNVQTDGQFQSTQHRCENENLGRKGWLTLSLVGWMATSRCLRL